MSDGRQVPVERANALSHLAAAVQKAQRAFINCDVSSTAMYRSSIAVSMETARAGLKMYPDRLRRTGGGAKKGRLPSATSLILQKAVESVVHKESKQDNDWQWDTQ